MTLTPEERHFKAAIFAAYIFRLVQDRNAADIELVKYCKTMVPETPEDRAAWVKFVKDLIARYYGMDISQIGLGKPALFIDNKTTRTYNIATDSKLFTEAKDAAIAHARVRNMIPPRPDKATRELRYTKILQVPVTAEQYDKIRQAAKNGDITIPEYVRRLL